LLVPATGCPSSTPGSWVTCCWSTLGGGAPGKAREGRPADANAIELGAGPTADAAGRLSEWPGSSTLDRALQLARALFGGAAAAATSLRGSYVIASAC
jgi:hypothetical protein